MPPAQLIRRGQTSAEFLAIATVASLFFLVVSHAFISNQAETSISGKYNAFENSISVFCSDARMSIQNPGALVRTPALPAGTKMAAKSARLDFSNDGLDSTCVLGAYTIRVQPAMDNASIFEKPMVLMHGNGNILEVMPDG